MKKDNSKTTLASWSDKEAKIKSLADGRARSYKEKKNRTGCSFDPETVLKISMTKYKGHHNYLALYLLKKGTDLTEIKNLVAKLNKPQHYKHERTFTIAIEKLLKVVNTESRKILTQEKVKELITQGITEKPIRNLSKEESKRHYKRETVRLLDTLTTEEQEEALELLQNKYVDKEEGSIQ
jgi:hypothetical protein